MPPSIQDYLIDLYQLIKQYLGQDSSILNIKSTDDFSLIEKYISQNLKCCLKHFPNEMKKVSIQRLYNIFNELENINDLECHEMSYNFIIKTANELGSNFYILLRFVNGKLLSHEALTDSNLNKNSRNGFEPSNCQTINYLYEKIDQVQKEKNDAVNHYKTEIETKDEEIKQLKILLAAKETEIQATRAEFTTREELRYFEIIRSIEELKQIQKTDREKVSDEMNHQKSLIEQCNQQLNDYTTESRQRTVDIINMINENKNIVDQDRQNQKEINDLTESKIGNCLSVIDEKKEEVTNLIENIKNDIYSTINQDRQHQIRINELTENKTNNCLNVINEKKDELTSLIENVKNNISSTINQDRQNQIRINELTENKINNCLNFINEKKDELTSLIENVKNNISSTINQDRQNQIRINELTENKINNCLNVINEKKDEVTSLIENVRNNISSTINQNRQTQDTDKEQLQRQINNLNQTLSQYKNQLQASIENVRSKNGSLANEIQLIKTENEKVMMKFNDHMTFNKFSNEIKEYLNHYNKNLDKLILCKEFHKSRFDGIFAALIKEHGNIYKKGIINIMCETGKLSETEKLMEFNLDDGLCFYSTGSDLIFDFKNKKVALSGYSLKSTNWSGTIFYFKSWVIEGSNNRYSGWTELDSRTNVEKFWAKSVEDTFEIKEKDKLFRYIRFRVINQNNFDLHRIELFGQLYNE